MAESPKFPRSKGNQDRGTRWCRQILTGCGNMAVSCMRNASGHNYRNSSFTVDVAMGRYHLPQNAFLVGHIL